MMSVYSVLAVSLLTLILIGQNVRANDQTDIHNETLWGTHWFEQRALKIALKESNKTRNQFYYSFNDDSSSCEDDVMHDFSFLDFRFRPNGITISENGGRLHTRWDTPVLVNDHTLETEIAANGCSMKLVLSRLRKTDNNWDFQTAKLDQTSKSVNGEGNDGVNGRPLHLSFESSYAEDCPIGGGPVYLFPNALVSDFGHNFDRLIKHVGGSEMLDTFTIGNTTCRYVMTVSHEIHSSKGTVPQRVMDLSFGEYRDRN